MIGHLKTIDGFNAYLQQYFSSPDHDLCLAIPGMAPWAIYQIFADLGVQNPHVYTDQDYAYAGVCQAEKKVANPKVLPDYDLLDNLAKMIRDSIFDPTLWPNVIATAKADLQNYPNLKESTHDMLLVIINFPPIIPKK